MAVRKDDLSEEAIPFILCERLHNRLLGARNHLPRLAKVQQQSTKAIAVFLIGSVIDLKPAALRPDRRPAGAYARAVPRAFAGLRNAAMVPPMLQVR